MKCECMRDKVEVKLINYWQPNNKELPKLCNYRAERFKLNGAGISMELNMCNEHRDEVQEWKPFLKIEGIEC